MNGFLSINKPSGISSANLLNKIKKILRENGDKTTIGHMGTLDKEASGVLVLAFGKSTRLFDLFQEKHKTYDTIFKFGVLTDTLDAEGNVIERSDKLPTKEEILAVLPEFLGKQMQMPPQFSAKKIGGVPAYRLARENKEFKLKPKEIEIFAFDLVSQEDKCCFSFEVVCSSGTYIRSLTRDLAERLGTVAIAEKIVRVKCGIFGPANSLFENQLTFEHIKRAIVKPNVALPFIESVKISNADFKDLLDGKSLKCDFEDGKYFVINENGDIMLIRIESKVAKISVNLKD